MRIFISGASGLVGGNCLQFFTSQHCEVVGTHLSYPTSQTFYFNTLSLGDTNNFDVLKFNPDVIVHCGALTHVDYCESNERESYEKTVQSTINLISVAKKTNATFVFLSTDYIFDGKNGPYTEDEHPHPLNIYGMHKLHAEQILQKEMEDYLILRVTNVYGKELRNKNFVARIIEQCKNGQEITLNLPYDQFASPTNAYDIARAMYQLLIDQKKGIYHIASSDYMNRIELAKRVLSYFPHVSYTLNPLDTQTLNAPASRPLLGGLLKAKFASEYPLFLYSTVDDFMNERILT
jgi:dTDP-4-dehydrorhamnose reductase